MRERPWKPCLNHFKCLCNKKLAEEKKKKSNRTGLSEGKSLNYPFPPDEETPVPKVYKTFKIKYDGNLSSVTRSIFNSFQNKYIYYAIDDILYLVKSEEQKDLLNLLYSTMLSLHNDFSVNFFDIWIDSVYINDNYKNNRFLNDKCQNFKKFTYITIKLYYTTRSQIKKLEPIW